MAESAAVERESAEALPSFDLTTRFLPDSVVVAVRGEIDLLTAPALGGLVAALMDRGHLDLVLDLADLDFMDAQGLGVLDAVRARLQMTTGSLTIRSPSGVVRRLLDVAAMTELVERRPVRAEASALGAEQCCDAPAAAGAASRPEPADGSQAVLAGLAVPTDLVDAALRLVTALTKATVGGADGVSVSLTRHGQLTTVAASDETIAQMDRDQYATGEGPCLAAASEGHWFHVESLADEERWPQFIPRAVAGGIASILSSPLLVGGRPLGALNIYSNRERAFGPQDQELAALFASHASDILAEARQDVTADEMGRRLRDALGTREVIAQAQGVLMAREGRSAETSYGALRQSSKRAGITVRDQAVAILATVDTVASGQPIAKVTS